MTDRMTSSMSRRQVVGGGATLAATSLASSTAKGREPMAAENVTNQELTNPTDKYPKPPYKKQSQPWPGLASKMDPRPDHGETSYKGSGRSSTVTSCRERR